MLPGPTYVYECQSCKGLFERRSISSGNTSRAKFRSDGQMSAPMLPTTPLLVACPHCNLDRYGASAQGAVKRTRDSIGLRSMKDRAPV